MLEGQDDHIMERMRKPRMTYRFWPGQLPWLTDLETKCTKRKIYISKIAQICIENCFTLHKLMHVYHAQIQEGKYITSTTVG